MSVGVASLDAVTDTVSCAVLIRVISSLKLKTVSYK